VLEGQVVYERSKDQRLKYLLEDAPARRREGRQADKTDKPGSGGKYMRSLR